MLPNLRIKFFFFSFMISQGLCGFFEQLVFFFFISNAEMTDDETVFQMSEK
jgi:hypothetical protein